MPALSKRELARRCGSTLERIEKLAALGILVPVREEGDERFTLGDLQRVDQPDALEITQRESLVALLSDGHEDAERCKLLYPFERAPATTGKLSLGQSWHRLSDGIGVMERAGYGRRSRGPRGTLHQAHSNPRGERRSDVWRQPRNANGTASGGEGTVLFIRHRSADHRSHPDCGAPDDGVTPPSWCAFSRPTSGPPGPTRPR